MNQFTNLDKVLRWIGINAYLMSLMAVSWIALRFFGHLSGVEHTVLDRIMLCACAVSVAASLYIVKRTRKL